ncbi:hypothetical protein [Marinoscillum pacificum]|uniref:hypothetical protein n=1 Tax=Marinoscillum pacificum TaxID=392723 RepID=UPI00215842C1|nr:hypothetical protein [Marinoscillum pacificum]
MKILKNLALAFLVSFAVVLVSCGDKGGDDPQTAKEILLEDLQGSWSLDAGASLLANLDINTDGIGATFTETGFTLSGAITSYVENGTYTISDAGAISSVEVTVKPTDLALDGTADVSINSTNDVITVEFSTKLADGRIDGLGDFKLVFNKAS